MVPGAGMAHLGRGPRFGLDRTSGLVGEMRFDEEATPGLRGGWWLSLPLTQQPPGISQDPGRLHGVVAGGRFDRVPWRRGARGWRSRHERAISRLATSFGSAARALAPEVVVGGGDHAH